MKEFEDVMIDISWKILDEENRRYKDIDGKAIGVITITGILVSFLITFAKTPLLNYNYFYYLAVFSFLVAVLLSIIVLIPRETEALSTKKLIADFKDGTPASQITGIIATIGKVEKMLRDVCNHKAKALIYSVIALGIGIIFLILCSVSTIFNIQCQGVSNLPF